MRKRLDFPSPLEDNEAWYLPDVQSEQIPSSPTADLVLIKKEAEEFYQRGFADTLIANLYSKHDETFHLGLKFMSHPLAGCYLPIYFFFFLTEAPAYCVRALWSTYSHELHRWGPGDMRMYCNVTPLHIWSCASLDRIWEHKCPTPRLFVMVVRMSAVSQGHCYLSWMTPPH